MKSILLLIIIFIILSLLPAPYQKTITHCVDDQCTTESKIEFGPPLAKTIFDKSINHQ